MARRASAALDECRTANKLTSYLPLPPLDHPADSSKAYARTHRISMQRVRNRIFFFSDILLLPLAALLAYAIRFEGVNWSAEAGQALTGFILFGLPVKLLILFSLGMYRRWRSSSSVPPLRSRRGLRPDFCAADLSRHSPDEPRTGVNGRHFLNWLEAQMRGTAGRRHFRRPNGV